MRTEKKKPRCWKISNSTIGKLEDIKKDTGLPFRVAIEAGVELVHQGLFNATGIQQGKLDGKSVQHLSL